MENNKYGKNSIIYSVSWKSYCKVLSGSFEKDAMFGNTFYKPKHAKVQLLRYIPNTKTLTEHNAVKPFMFDEEIYYKFIWKDLNELQSSLT